MKEDGSFQLKGLSGRRLLRVSNLPPGWTLKSVRLNGDDVTDSGVDFKSGQDISGLEVVASSKQTEITGGVTASNGSALKDYTVVVFSDDPQHWSLPFTRWVNGTRPDQEGRFRLRNLPAGQLQHRGGRLHRGRSLGRSGTARSPEVPGEADHAVGGRIGEGGFEAGGSVPD